MKEEIEIELSDEELLEHMKRAHELDITFNQYVENILRQHIEELSRES